jgi:hypothetical protein
MEDVASRGWVHLVDSTSELETTRSTTTYHRTSYIGSSTILLCSPPNSFIACHSTRRLLARTQTVGDIITVGPREATADISKHCSQWKEQWLLIWLAIRKGTDRVTGTG